MSNTGVAAEISELLNRGDLEGAIKELREIEARAGSDNTQSVLITAIHRRLELRVGQSIMSIEEIEVHKAGIGSRLLKAAEEIWNKGTSLGNDPTGGIQHVLLLLHGIRTHADWFGTVERIFLNETSCETVPIRYGYFDLARFLMPFGRGAPIKKIRRELKHAKAKYPHAKISVIAHSFGTYALMQAIRNDQSLELFRVILCGSVLSEDWNIESYFITRGESTDIVNDCGVKDIWPVLARCFSWGYGASGTFGKAGVGVRDRKFPYSHSDFFNPSFISHYWVPFIKDGKIVLPDTRGVSMQPPTMINALSSPLLSGLIRLAVWTAIPSLLILLAYILARRLAFFA